MENNIYDLTKVSKNSAERSKRLQANTVEYLKQYDQNLKEATELKEAQNMEAAMSAARFTAASTYARSKNRVMKLNEEIQYNETSSLVGMTEMVAQVVESALLLDAEEYAALNPGYKTAIRDTVYDLLKESEINENITNKDTLAIMEYVARTIPSVKEGINLTEDELSNYIDSNKPVNIDSSIRNLSGSVSSKVAQLMEKEQKRAEKIEKDIEKASAAKAAKEQAVEEPVEEEYAEEVPAEESEYVEEEQPQDEEYVEEEPVEEEYAEGQQPMGKSIHIAADGTTSISMPNGQLALNGDGSMDIQLMESTFVRETPRSGLLESLAVNEAQNMLNRGESYNPDLCLANAIMYVTITEALNEMGLVEVGEKEYSHIISAAGGNINEARGYIKRYAKRQATPSDMKRVADASFINRYHAYEFGKDAAMKYARVAKLHNSGETKGRSEEKEMLVDATRDVRGGKIQKRWAKEFEIEEDKLRKAKAKEDEKEEAKLRKAKAKEDEKEEAKLRKAEKKGLSKKKNLTEAAVTQWGVQQNKSNPDDLAERIRQRKLLKENTQNLNE